MRKLVLAGVALLALSTVAEARDRYNYHHRPQPHHHRHYHSHNYVPWVAGGLALGLLGAGAYYYQENRIYNYCWREHVGFDRFGNPVYQQFCQ